MQGFYFLHGNDPPIIHRDIKPDNILIKLDHSRNFVKIADFGYLAFHEFIGKTSNGFVLILLKESMMFGFYGLLGGGFWEVEKMVDR